MELQDILHTDGEDNTAGIQQIVMVAKLDDIATLPKPEIDDSTASGAFADSVTVKQNIVMKSGKYFKKLYCTLEAGGLKSDLQGELDGKSFKNTLELFHPGSKAEALGFIRWAKNSSLIFLVPEADNQVRLFGHEGYPAKMTGGGADTGMKPADRKGIKLTFESSGKCPSPIFTGQVRINIASGTVDADGDSNQDIYFITGS